MNPNLPMLANNCNCLPADKSLPLTLVVNIDNVCLIFCLIGKNAESVEPLKWSSIIFINQSFFFYSLALYAPGIRPPSKRN